RKFTRTFDVAQKQITRTTPEGRITVTTLDEHGRPVKIASPGTAPVLIAYDKQGRVASWRQGDGLEERVLSLNYNAQGRLASVTDPLKRITRFEYDPAGRVKKHFLSDEREIALAFDAGGNLASPTPPGQPAPAFAYTPANLPKDYQPPSLGAGSRDTAH